MSMDTILVPGPGTYNDHHGTIKEKFKKIKQFNNTLVLDPKNNSNILIGRNSSVASLDSFEQI